MCLGCSDDPQERAQAKQEAYATMKNLERLVEHYSRQANGHFHSDKSKGLDVFAKSAIRELVGDWVR